MSLLHKSIVGSWRFAVTECVGDHKRRRYSSFLRESVQHGHHGPGVHQPPAAERAEELLSNADREMYAHKRSRAGVHRLLQLAESSPRPVTDQR